MLKCLLNAKGKTHNLMKSGIYKLDYANYPVYVEQTQRNPHTRYKDIIFVVANKIYIEKT